MSPIQLDELEKVAEKYKRYDTVIEGIRFVYPPSFSDTGLKKTVIGKIKREFLGLLKAYGFKQVIISEEYTAVRDYRALRDTVLVDPVFRFSATPVDVNDVVDVKVIYTYMLPYASIDEYLKLYYSGVPKTKLLTHNIVVRGYVMIGYDAKRNVLVLPHVFITPPNSKHVLIARNVLAYTRMLLESARNNTPLPLDQSTMSPLIRDTMLMLNLRPTRVSIVIEGQSLFKHLHLYYAGNDVDVYNRDTEIELVMHINRKIQHIMLDRKLFTIHPVAEWRGTISLVINKSDFSIKLLNNTYVYISGHRISHPNTDDSRICTGTYDPYNDFKSLLKAGKGLIEAGLSVLTRVVNVLEIPNLDSAYSTRILDFVKTRLVKSLDDSGISADVLSR